MRLYRINDELTIGCESQGTRYGFRHLATLFRNGREISKAKVCYYNRTWECYEFDSVMHSLAEKRENAEYKALIKEFIEARGHE